MYIVGMAVRLYMARSEKLRQASGSTLLRLSITTLIFISQRLFVSASKTQTKLLNIQFAATKTTGPRMTEQINMQREMDAALQQIKHHGAMQFDAPMQQPEADRLQVIGPDVLYELIEAHRTLCERNVSMAPNQSTHTDWLNSPGQCSLVPADSGRGKSVLARDLIDNELLKRDPEPFISYFFF
ncbi:MAG: hypothetical protein GOMPHAMPRED_000438 [Gomphillus americanus]|uniref:Uncharacterized protein n=1 Tax=Gomphillus americanus TaxID=1940652 RepID=A0A8H3I526_9LECA|nr:MAG: hypothetical protein GOMPHAMPRED_000438 [Gomphillus americanus]